MPWGGARFVRPLDVELTVVAMRGWRRAMLFGETGLPWVMPSPNMPTIDSATVYPGSVLLEGTEVSEGRGTTRPFELIGAPYIDAKTLVTDLAGNGLPGVAFREAAFEPTFNKFAGKICSGVQIHVTDRDLFKPLLTGVAIISAIRRLFPEDFAWKQPPYEYVYDRMPFDVICGGSRLREQIEAGVTPYTIESSWLDDVVKFRSRREAYLLYD
jgi:uncharacterized protein YbbC (DUF1343 family)